MSDIVFRPQFAATARAEISRRTAKTWDPGLARDPRLLVPVDVQALVVPPGNAEPHADVAVRLLRAPAAPGETFDTQTQRAAPPFTDAPAARPPGVYLHWALPDGLTAGRATDGTTPDGRLNLRPLPNRWLVVRLHGDLPRRLEAWVVEAERGRSVRLRQWSEGPASTEGRTPGLDAADLTAVAGGDPAWAAVYDNVEDRFGLYDDLAGVDLGEPTISYVVVGWYSRADLDPLHGAADFTSFRRRLTELGWTVDDAKLAAAFAGAQTSVERRGTIDLQAPALRLGPSVGDVSTVRGETVTVPAPQLAGKITAGAAEVRVDVRPSGIHQSLYHGAIWGVRVDGTGPADARPGPAAVRLALGASATEATAAFLNAALGGDEVGERLFTAFGYGVADRLGQPDGMAAVDEEVHRRGFLSLPGGSVEERIRMGNALAGLRGQPGTTGDPVPGTGRRFEAKVGKLDNELLFGADASSRKLVEGVRQFAPTGFAFELVERVPGITGTLLDASTRPQILDPPPDPLRFVTVQRALPRWFFPTDPVALVSGLNRSLRHGYDGRFEPDERLACRLSGDISAGYQGLIQGADLVGGSLEHGGVPDEADELVREAALHDWPVVDRMAEFVGKVVGTDAGIARTRLRAEQQVATASMFRDSDATLLGVGSLLDGRHPSPVWATYWRQPWVPLYLEWEMELAVDGRTDRWQLGELDLELDGDPAGASNTTLTGRSLLTSGGVKALAGEVTAFLAEEEKRDKVDGRGLLTPEEARLLRDFGTRAAGSDLLGSAFEGIREHLLGFDTNAGLSAPGAPHIDAAPVREPMLVRGGVAKVVRVRVVDAFGRTLALPDALLKSAVIADQLASPSGAPEMLLPPRLNPPSRLLLRLVDPDDETADARIDQERPEAARSPVGAWLLPDHVDGALEIFDRDGNPLGQLLHEGLGETVVWEGAPGRPGPAGAGPSLGSRPGDRHAAALAVAVIRQDAADRGLPEADRPEESPLSALLRAIDTTLWTVDPIGMTGLEHVSVLTGRPIALVRARLQLEVQSDVDQLPLDEAGRRARQATFDALAATPFTVRLGALARADDGLLGWFLEDDYSRLHLVHRSVPLEARPGGPRVGFLGPHDSVPAYAAALPTTVTPILHPYVLGDPELEIRPGHPVNLTLLVVPGGKIHLTSGISPRKEVGLLRDWIADALARISPSFRFGPVLVDPMTIRMPRVAALPKEQVWTRRTSPGDWRDDPIVAASQQALLPEAPAQAQEGYIRVRIDAPEDA